MPGTVVKQEVQRLSSRHRDGTAMFTGAHVLTWLKAPGMPWVLIRIEKPA